MLSDYNAALGRIQAIESRIHDMLSVNNPQQTSPDMPINVPGASAAVTPAPNSSSFGSLLATAGNLPTLKGPQFSPYIEGLISKYAGANSLDPNLVRAVIAQESGGNANDVSSKGARGLMQIMPEEARSLGVSDPFDPEQNIAAGTKLLSTLLKKYQGDIPLALAAYNAGSGAVSRFNGVPPFPETQKYVRNILHMLGQ